MDKKVKKLLIISNNVLSETNNNGKTILSFINGVDNVEISQLYFSGEVPRVKGYNYFRISDKDIIRGFFKPNLRGNTVNVEETGVGLSDDFSIKQKVGRNDFTVMAREMLWKNKWKSEALVNWLDGVSPDAIFFIAGDACFAYSICEYIQGKYRSRLTTYITDDYVMPRKNEKLLHKIHRGQVDRHLRQILKKTACFYTISEPMRDAYRDRYGKDSYMAVNMTEDMQGSYEKDTNEIVLTYTGSFYYKRDEVLSEVAKAIYNFNMSTQGVKAKLYLYSNREPDKDTLAKICVNGASEYCGSLNKDQLRQRLNTSDILVFVESMEEEQIEKVRYSLSTKVPEYLSVGKPILAIGPKGIGSMEYLKSTAICINNQKEILGNVVTVLNDIDSYKKYGEYARVKFISNHNKNRMQKEFVGNVIGIEILNGNDDKK